MNYDDLLLQDSVNTTPGKWATVTQASPLRIMIDGDSSALGFAPDTLVADLAVDDRVWVQAYKRRLVISGRSGGAVIANTSLVDMAQSTIKGRAASAGTGDPTDLSVSQVTTILGGTSGTTLAIGNHTHADLTTLTSAWSTWSPTLTNLTLGSGSVVARHRTLGKTGDFLFVFTLGSGSAVGTGPSFTLPFTPNSTAYPQYMPMGIASGLDAGTNNYPLVARSNGSTSVEILTVTSGVHSNVTSTVPFTWGSGDKIMVRGAGIEIA